ncbi:DM13 domain-containing protein [Microbacterium sp.]|uniref:DM13 domain-containing protein n=1 Tax=Microbacterium sp. TaxID=51671 RepID=UPI0033403883
MRKTAVIPAALLFVGLSLAGCSAGGTSDEPMKPSSSSDSMSTDKPMDMAMKKGDFMGLNGKKVAGTVTVSDTELTLEGFSSDEGPDLHVYLANGTDEAAVSAGMQIDAVAFDKASQTFSLKDVDLSKYTDVVIHCDKAKAVFGAAALS